MALLRGMILFKVVTQPDRGSVSSKQFLSFCVKNNWQIIFLTMDYGSFLSFAIREI